MLSQNITATASLVLSLIFQLSGRVRVAGSKVCLCQTRMIENNPIAREREGAVKIAALSSAVRESKRVPIARRLRLKKPGLHGARDALRSKAPPAPGVAAGARPAEAGESLHSAPAGLLLASTHCPLLLLLSRRLSTPGAIRLGRPGSLHLSSPAAFGARLDEAGLQDVF
jgi:hypothetical protein